MTQPDGLAAPGGEHASGGMPGIPPSEASPAARR